MEKLITLPEGEVVNICIHDIECDRDKLVAEQQADESLKNVFELARRNEKGYALDEGILVHYNLDSIRESCERVVVPCGRRKCIGIRS